MTHGDGQSMGTGPQGGGSRVGGRPIKGCRPTNGFFESGRFDKDFGISIKCFVGRQLFLGPICQRLAPLRTLFCSRIRRQEVPEVHIPFKKKKFAKSICKTDFFKKSSFLLKDFGHFKKKNIQKFWTGDDPWRRPEYGD